MPPIDLTRLRLGRSSSTSPKTRLPRPGAGEKFLKGPIPLHWLSAAAKLPGKSLHVALAVWFAASLAKSATVPVGNITVLPFGLDRNAKYRALAWLEKARLISVERGPGKSPVVTVLEMPRGEDGQT